MPQLENVQPKVNSADLSPYIIIKSARNWREQNVNKSRKSILGLGIAENSQSRCMALKTCLKRSTWLTHIMVGMVGILNTRNCVKLAGTLGIGLVSVHI